MENKASKKIKILMGVILLLFLIPSGIDFAKGFSQGWSSSEREYRISDEHGIDYQSFFVELEPTRENQRIDEIGNGHQFLSFEEHGQLILAEKMSSVWWVITLRVFLSLTITILLVWFVVLLFRFAAKLSRRRVLAEENIHSLRRIAYVLGAFSICGYLMMSIEIFWLRSHVVLDGYRIAFPEFPSSLIVALIILVMTEILKLGHKLQQEQELTI